MSGFYQADDIYIMMKCVYVCLSVTFLLILPSPKVFTPDDPPRPSWPKAGLGLVMIMLMLQKQIELICHFFLGPVVSTVWRSREQWNSNFAQKFVTFLCFFLAQLLLLLMFVAVFPCLSALRQTRQQPKENIWRKHWRQKTLLGKNMRSQKHCQEKTL